MGNICLQQHIKSIKVSLLSYIYPHTVTYSLIECSKLEAQSVGWSLKYTVKLSEMIYIYSEISSVS